MNRPTVAIQYISCNVRDRGQVNLSPKPRGMLTSSQRGSSLNFLNENLQKKKKLQKNRVSFPWKSYKFPKKFVKKYVGQKNNVGKNLILVHKNVVPIFDSGK